ncbi:MAG: ribonuclease P protein component [Andreesenia angusta]|nr:ribonuclease P protein component [Andreesenia angusta]
MKKMERLKSDRDFQRIYKNGNSFANKYLIVFFMKNKMNINRVGFVTTKKLGNSVKRNKYKRRLKESYRLNSNKLKKGYDMIFLFRKNIPELEYKDINSALNHIISISGLKKGRK